PSRTAEPRGQRAAGDAGTRLKHFTHNSSLNFVLPGGPARLAMTLLRTFKPVRFPINGNLSAYRRNVGPLAAFVRRGRRGGIPVGHVRRWRRVPADALAHLLWHPLRRGGGDHDEPRHGLVDVGRPCPLAQPRRRPEARRGHDGERHRGHRCRRMAVRPVARGRPDGADRFGILCDPARHHRHADAAGVAGDIGGIAARRAGAFRTRAESQLDSRLAAQDAVSGFAALHQRDPTGADRIHGRRAVGDHGHRRRVRSGAGVDLSGAGAREHRDGHVAAADHIRDGIEHDPAFGERFHRRHRSGGHTDFRRGDRGATWRADGSANAWRAVALLACGTGARRRGAAALRIAGVAWRSVQHIGGCAMKRALIAICLAMCTGAAEADDLVAGLSQDIIQITSNYTGTDIVAFGAIENMNVMTAAGPLDIVVAVRGPDADITVRKKERVAGIWLNNHGVVMRAIPSYYYVASTRP